MQYQNRTPRTLMKRVSVILLGLAALVPAVAFATDLTAEQILDKVSKTYAGLSSFRFVDRRASKPPFSPWPLSGPGDLAAPFGDRPANCTTDLAVSTPGRTRLVEDCLTIGQSRLGVGSIESKVLLVSDGRKTWVYIPDLNGYEELAAAPLLEELWMHPMTLIGDDLARYRNLSLEERHAKLRGEEALSLEGQKVRCYVVELLANSVWRTLWIDGQRFIVLRDEASFYAPGGGYFADAASLTLQMTKAELGPISDEVFQFAVPSGAHRLDSFSVRSGPVQSAEEALAARLVGSEKKEYLLPSSKARDFTAGSLGGENVRLDGLHGKIVVLDFWASWCEPCQVELAAIQKLHDELASKGVVFLGINDEDSKAVGDFVKAHGYTFSMLLDSQQTVHGLYGVRLVPTTVVIDRKGKIAAHYVGAGGEAQLRRALKSAGLNTTP